MGMGIPLIAVPTLKLMAAQVVNEGLAAIESSLLCPMIDARRMEVYAAVYDTNLNCLRDVAADIVEAGTYDDFMNTHKVYFFGNGSDKCRSVITSPNAAFIEGVNPLASGMVSLAESAFEASAFEDVAYFVPFYLKDFQATTPKKLF
jgi:tRNA threonylcarbamoyladenosine biosynthesis protein TsaB